jgi:hypothetical protein
MTAGRPIPPALTLPVAVRGHTSRDPPRTSSHEQKQHRLRGSGGAVLVFDTETTIDPAQALLFGCWRYYRAHPVLGLHCVDEGLFYADDLPESDPAGFAVLQRVAATARSAAGPDRPLPLLSRAQWISQVFYPAAWEGRATVVGFNLPFDLSRIAIAAAEGRGRNLRGFSFTFAEGNRTKGHTERRHVPRVQVKHLNSHAAFIHFASALQQTSSTRGWRGEFVDLRTLTYALTGKGHSLKTACRTFGLPGKANPDGHGRITPAYIDYCRTDVQRTAQLYQRCVAELESLNLPITPARAYSPASLSKAVLDTLGVAPLATRADPLPPEMLGRFMSAFYGGRAECRIRRTEVPVSLVDFTSMYPTLFALMRLWDYCVAQRLDTEDATDAVRGLLASVALDGFFDPALWPQIVGVAQVEPDGDILPVRARYDERKASWNDKRKTNWNIGVNYFTGSTPLWYAIPDLVASTLLAGKPPKILRAVRLIAHGQLDTLQSWTMPGGRVLDPRVEAPWPAMIEHRQTVRHDPTLPIEERDRIQRFLKISACAGGYGIHVECNRRDLPTGRREGVTVCSYQDQSFTARVTGPEDPGRFFFPPLAAVITAGARLMLAILERCVTDAAGAWAFADTDSMAIVATDRGGLVPCPGGQHRDDQGRECAHALSYAQVARIRDRFAALNPYDRAAVSGSILKHELDAYCYAVAAKRYALYRYDDKGRLRLVPGTQHEPCSHGLGHLLNPTDPDSEDRDWIRQFWEHYLAREITDEEPTAPGWLGHPALGKIAITSPTTWRQLAHHNHGKPYRDRIKPFGFLLHAPGAQLAAQPDDCGRLVAPYSNQPDRWLTLDWIDLNNPDRPIKITTDPTKAGRALIDTYDAIADTYFTHREAKAANPDGTPAGRASRGPLYRRHVYADSIAIIGKEANDLDGRVAGLASDPTAEPSLTVYRPHRGIEIDTLEIARLRQIGAGRLAIVTGMSERRLRDILQGKAFPHAAARRKLTAALEYERTSPPGLAGF